MKTAKAKGGGPQVSPEAKRRAAVLYEVLAGVRAPQQAAEVLGLSLAGFYQMEERATLQVQLGCEVRPRGRQATGESKAAALVKEVERLRQEVVRYQALLRLRACWENIYLCVEASRLTMMPIMATCTTARALSSVCS